MNEVAALQNNTLKVDAAVFPIPLSDIHVPTYHRKHSQIAIQAFAEDIERIDLRSPIEVVVTDGSRYSLVIGALRLAAFEWLSRPDIPAFVKKAEEFASEAALRLVSISENMVRREPTVLEESIYVADWCAIYRAAQPSIKPGPKPSGKAAPELSINLIPNSADSHLLEASSNFAASFSDAAQAFLGFSRAGVFRALKIASISALQRDRIAFDDLADNQSELLALANLPAERQGGIVDLILSKAAGTVARALEIIEGRQPVAPAPWETFSQRFTKLKEQEQHRFFDLHSAAIERWDLKRKRR